MLTYIELILSKVSPESCLTNVLLVAAFASKNESLGVTVHVVFDANEFATICKLRVTVLVSVI